MPAGTQSLQHTMAIIITTPKSNKTPLAIPLPTDWLPKNIKGMTLSRKYSILMIFQDLVLLRMSDANENMSELLVFQTETSFSEWTSC